jgi:threonine/homoserine/homoserine lactone efflux protein
VTLAAFLFAVLALLLAPGPTNTLMAVAGAQGGVGRAARLLPAELGGYLAAILPLAIVGAEVLERFPAAGVALKLAAAIWVMLLALRLWGIGGAAAAAQVGARRVFVTTLLNPKAVIFALILLPPPADPQFLPRLALFCLTVACVALLWGAAGALTQGGGRIRVVERIASVWLALVSVTLVLGVVQV